MTITDGAILFAACAFSFALGYVIGAVRISRFVNKQLSSIGENVATIQKHNHELQQLYSRLGGKAEDRKEKQA
jgi:hypothetical protein